MKEFEEIKVIGIDKEGIKKKSPTNIEDDFYEYPFILSHPPDALWINIFEGFWRDEREIDINNDRLIVIVSPDDNKKELLESTKVLINDTNYKYKRYLQEEEGRLLKLRNQADKLVSWLHNQE